jgi:hypothetical protein
MITINGVVSIESAVSQLETVRRAVAILTEERRELEQTITNLLNDLGTDSYDSSTGVRVRLEQRPRRTFNLSVLSTYLPATVVASLIRQDVDSSAFDSAVSAGLVPADVADKATEVSYSQQVRVYGARGVAPK